ncbi:D-amino acid dehydrogenase small subunit [Betaproteobacteria bacterium]|nr:D-amino acid dehydrogenase small subunit [Betaproteobacteria bacterium]GHU44714.1 D-amino acid dehydrogenase small subunit [Betaproteobacteria bacterium]
MKILVLGAGVIGTTSAWYLRQAGHEVTVLERRERAALETSFANGGQISVSHAEPWANPHAIPQALAWLGREDAPLLFRLRPHDFALLRWSFAFLHNCLPARTRDNIRAIVRLALYSRAQLQHLRQTLSETADFNREYDGLQKGILHIYTEREAFKRAIATSRLMQNYGLEREPIDAETCINIEPALAPIRHLLAGGDYTPTDESGDAHRFTQALAARAAAAGVSFHYNAPVVGLELHGRKLQGVTLQDGRSLKADACVLALGSYSAPFLHPYGIHLPIYPAKGYSATLELENGTPAPSVSLTDDTHKLVFSRLGNRLRVAGTAEFNGFNLEINPTRCQALLQRAGTLFPDLRYSGDPNFWCGLRPATPSNVPLIGQSKLPGLWLNTGHGTLGWTMACGSAAALTDLMAGQKSVVAFPFL